MSVEILGIDIGGTGIKAALVNTETGELTTKRLRISTPPTFQPHEIIGAVQQIVTESNYTGPVGVGFPAVVINGTVRTPPTSHNFPGWVDYPVAQKLSETLNQPTIVVNDADAAGIAEMSFGAGRGKMGVVMIFTLGTGIGSAVFINGRLVPNTELGRVYLKGKKKDAENQAAERARKEGKLSWKRWGTNLNTYFNHIERLFSPQLIIIGGGVSKKHDKFLPFVNIRAEIVPATLRNNAGVIGAAMAANQLDN